MSSAMDPEQQDWHCIMTADGVDWWIVKVEGHLIYVIDLWYGMVGTVINVSQVDWESYCAKAVAMDYAREGGPR